MTLYRRGSPALEEPIHWQWLEELIHAKILVEVEVDVGAAADELRDQQDNHGPLWATFAERILNAGIKDVE